MQERTLIEIKLPEIISKEDAKKTGIKPSIKSRDNNLSSQAVFKTLEYEDTRFAISQVGVSQNSKSES